jgi:hypothetical protein
MLGPVFGSNRYKENLMNARKLFGLTVLLAAVATVSISSVRTAISAAPGGARGPTTATIDPVNPPDKYPAVHELPDPFTFLDGTKMKSKDDWKRRREELNKLIQDIQYGPYPPKPDKVAGVLNGNALTVTVEYKGKSISYNANIQRPAGDGPFPAFICVSGMNGIDARTLNARGIAYISYQPNQIAADSIPTVGQRRGMLYDLYGGDSKTSALMGWGWAIHRIMDALETLPDAKINVKKIGVTGYSRYGKGAIVAGAFDERVALTVPGGSGAGGVGSWRAAEGLQVKVQTLQQINGEAPQWFTDGFAAYGPKVDNLPFDAHEIIALCAPRAVIVQEGTQDSWNNNAAGGPFQAAWAAKKVYDYLDVPDNIGWVTGPHGHGGTTPHETEGILAFVDKFLLDKDVPTKYFDESAKPPEITWSAPPTK